MKRQVTIEKLPSGKYRVRHWETVNGKPKFVSEWFSDYGLAQRRAADLTLLLTAMKQGQPFSLAKPTELLNEYVNDPEVNEGEPFAEATKELKLNLRGFVEGFSSITQMTAFKIKAYLGTFENQTTRSIRYRDLHAFCAWALKKGYIQDNPFIFVNGNGGKEKLAKPRSAERDIKLSLEEIKKLINLCPPSLRLRLFHVAFTGKRKGEILKTEWKHLDLKHKTWFIPADNSKSKKDYTVPLNPTLALEFEKYQALTGHIVGRVHPKNNLGRELHKLAGRANIQVKVTPHVFRHSFASHWRGSPQVLMGLLGWSSPAMIQKYTHLNAEDLRQEAETKGLPSGLSL